VSEGITDIIVSQVVVRGVWCVRSESLSVDCHGSV
jgi:hypothetical protein